MPAMVIGTPSPAEVATARRIGLPCSVRIMLAIDPPLIPTSDAASPTKETIGGHADRPRQFVGDPPVIAAGDQLEGDDAADCGEAQLQHRS